MTPKPPRPTLRLIERETPIRPPAYVSISPEIKDAILTAKALILRLEQRHCGSYTVAAHERERALAAAEIVRLCGVIGK